MLTEAVVAPAATEVPDTTTAEPVEEETAAVATADVVV